VTITSYRNKSLYRGLRRRAGRLKLNNRRGRLESPASVNSNEMMDDCGASEGGDSAPPMIPMPIESTTIQRIGNVTFELNATREPEERDEMEEVRNAILRDIRDILLLRDSPSSSTFRRDFDGSNAPSLPSTSMPPQAGDGEQDPAGSVMGQNVDSDNGGNNLLSGVKACAEKLSSSMSSRLTARTVRKITVTEQRPSQCSSPEGTGHKSPTTVVPVTGRKSPPASFANRPTSPKATPTLTPPTSHPPTIGTGHAFICMPHL